MRAINKAAGLLILAMLLLAGCKTTRETVNRDETVQQVVATEVQQTTQAQTNEKVNTVERLAEAESAVITEKETYLSAPDSSGNQYPEKVIERQIETGKKREQNKATATETVTTVAQTESQNAEIKTDTKTDIKVKTKQKQRWPWQVTIGIVALAVVAFFILRNRLKWLIK